jgi:hypothetical protein
VAPLKYVVEKKDRHTCGVNYYRNEPKSCVAVSTYVETKRHSTLLWQLHSRCGKVWRGTKHPHSFKNTNSNLAKVERQLEDVRIKQP